MIDGPMQPRRFAGLLSVGVLAALFVASAMGPLSAQAPARQVTQSLAASVTFAQRTSLRLSTDVLRFDVTDAATPATATLDFSAGARTASGDEVRLVIDTLSNLPGTLMITDGTGGIKSGEASPIMPTIVARWTGGGLRSGRLTFALRCGIPGRYAVPISLRLSIS